MSGREPVEYGVAVAGGLQDRREFFAPDWIVSRHWRTLLGLLGDFGRRSKSSGFMADLLRM